MAMINIVTKAQVYDDNPIYRIDSEFFDTGAMNIDRMIRQIPHFTLEKSRVVSGPFGSSLKSSAYLKVGDVPFIRIVNIKGGFHIDTTNMVYISAFNSSRISNSELVVDDIILSKVGNSIGFFARVDNSLGVCNISENNIGIKLNGLSTVTKHYILVFLNTNIARQLVLCRTSGNAQLKLYVEDVCHIPIPVFSEAFYRQISELVLASEAALKSAKFLYAATEQYLLDSLGFADFIPSDNKITIRGLADSFRASNRIDAEYYQQKYDDVFLRLKNLPCDRLGKVVTIKKSVEPGSDLYGTKGIPFVRVSDLTKFGINDPDIKVPAHLTELRPYKDTILLTKDGSVGIAYKVEKDLDCITSGAVLHLTVKQNGVLPDYLTLVLNSIIVQSQAERDAGGSIIQHWKPSEIGDVIIPILDDDTQKKITTDVQSSFSLRRQSEQLLNFAKQAVEMAIEEGEDIAMKWLGVFTKGKSGGPKA